MGMQRPVVAERVRDKGRPIAIELVRRLANQRGTGGDGPTYRPVDIVDILVKQDRCAPQPTWLAGIAGHVAPFLSPYSARPGTSNSALPL